MVSVFFADTVSANAWQTSTITSIMFYYIVSVLLLLFFWCSCMGGLLPDIILLTQCYYHRGTRLNVMKRFCVCSLWSHLNVLTFPPPDWRMLRRYRRVMIFR